jgi:hypothetical protein
MVNSLGKWLNSGIRTAWGVKDKPYYAVNREERFFCSLLAHALLSSAYFRRSFVELISSPINTWRALMYY